MTVAARFSCERCGRPLETVEVTRLGDAERAYLVSQPCDCPGPRCPCCGRRLYDGRCPALVDCPVAGCLVPVPDVR